MNFINKAKEAAAGFSGGQNQQDQQPPQGEGQPQGQPQGQAGGQEDYLDKAFDSATQKAGYGGKLSREQSEKITDGARGAFEKLTGKHVPEKFSN